jgi:hypothetical protein
MEYNGLLLLPNLDRAFDLGYTTFDETGNIQISKMLKNPEQAGIWDSMQITLREEHQGCLEYHREYVFKH